MVPSPRTGTRSRSTGTSATLCQTDRLPPGVLIALLRERVNVHTHPPTAHSTSLLRAPCNRQTQWVMTGMCPFFTYLSLAIGQIKPQRSFKAEGVALPVRRGAERRRRSTASRSVALLLLRALCALLCIFHVPFFLVEDTPDLSAPTCAAAQLWMNYCVSR